MHCQMLHALFGISLYENSLMVFVCGRIVGFIVGQHQISNWAQIEKLALLLPNSIYIKLLHTLAYHFTFPGSKQSHLKLVRLRFTYMHVFQYITGTFSWKGQSKLVFLNAIFNNLFRCTYQHNLICFGFLVLRCCVEN